LAMLQV